MASHKKKSSHPQVNPAETMHELAHDKREHAQQTPAWPDAKEHAEPQHARAHNDAPKASPREAGNEPPSESGYERSDVGKRHH